MPGAVRELEQRTRRLGQMPHERRGTPLVVDDRHLVLLGAQIEHRPNEVRAHPAEEPGRANDPAVLHLALASELRAPVLRNRPRLVRLDIRLGLAAVEDIVGREIDDRSAQRSDISGSLDVDTRCALGVSLGSVDIGPSRGVENKIRPVPEGDRARHVELRPVAGIRIREDLGESGAELPARAGDQEAA